MRRRPRPTFKINSNLKEWLRSFGFALITLLIIKFLLIDIARVPSGSMENAVLPGDYLVMSKLSYGPRLPITPVSLPFSENWYTSFISLPYFRLPGFAKPQQGDIVVFNHPGEKHRPVDCRTLLLKRVAGLPGDTLHIVDSKVFTGRDTFSIATARHSYYIKKDNDIQQRALEKAGIKEKPGMKDAKHIIVWADSTQRAILEAHYGRENIVQAIKTSWLPDPTLSGFARYGWNVDQFGPIYIPAKGDTLHFSRHHADLYIEIIRHYEPVTLEEIDGEIVIDGQPIGYYVFQHNYYFVLGDHRHDSIDSRFWGLLPETHIVGKAFLCLFSIDNVSKKWRLARTLRWLD